MARILVRRSNDTVGAFRRVKILVDGEVVARLRPGGTAEVTVEPGEHVVLAVLDWQRSPHLTVTTGEEPVEIEASVPWRAMAYLFTGRGLLLTSKGFGV